MKRCWHCNKAHKKPGSCCRCTINGVPIKSPKARRFMDQRALAIRAQYDD